jgi:hypothetical protein
MAKQVFLTQEDAEKKVPTHVDPKECFMWENLDLKKQGEEERYQNIPPEWTGCAHWVAHQKGWNNGKNLDNGCCKGYLLRVTDVVRKSGSEVAPKDVQVGNVWANTSGHSHCGIVSKVEAPTEAQKEYDDLRKSLEEAIDAAKKAYDQAKSLVAESETRIAEFAKEQGKDAFKKKCAKAANALASAQKQVKELKPVIDAAQKVYDSQTLK